MNVLFKSASVFLLLFISIGALYGSFMLLSDTTGESFGMSLEYLEGSPFDSFLIPGIVLLLINGLYPLFVCAAVLLNSRNTRRFLLIQGLLLIGWLSIQLAINRDFFIPQLHIPLYVDAALLVLLGSIKRPDHE